MPKARYIQVSEILEKRLDEQVYSLNSLPSERKLAMQLGVSYLTARKAVSCLVDKGVLKRGPNGRPNISSQKKPKQNSLNIAFLSPPQIWAGQHSWYYELSQLVDDRNGKLRPITYYNVSDPVFFEALDGDFDGFFIVLPPDIPPLLLDKLAKKKERIVILWRDLTHLGIPSIENAPPRFVGKLLDHLSNLGHKRIDCINTQGTNPVVKERIEYWNMGIEQRNLAGKLHDTILRPHRPGLRPIREYFCQLIDQGRLSETTAIFCTTTSQAWAAMRACNDRCLKVGHDISICGFGEMDIAEMLMPSVTAVQPADRKIYLALGLEWIENHGKKWHRPLRLEPEDVPLFIGESTGPAPAGTLKK